MNVDELFVQADPTREMMVPGGHSPRASTIFEKSLSTTTVPTRFRSPRRVLVAAAVIILISGLSTVMSVRGLNGSPSLPSSLTRAFGTVNAGASTGDFILKPMSPSGFNLLTCPTSQICYLASPESVDTSGTPLPTTAFKTLDGGASWSKMSMPSAGIPDTPFSCPTVLVCSVGVVTRPTGSRGSFSTGTVQSILSTANGGASWTSRVVSVKPVKGIDPSLDSTLANVQGRWTQLQCFGSTACVATASVLSDQPQASTTGVGTAGVYRAVFMRTNNGGASWKSVVLPWAKKLDGTSGWSSSDSLTISCASASVCLGLSTVGHTLINNPQATRVLIWRSTDGGMRWSASWAPAPVTGHNTLTCPTSLRCYAVVFTGESHEKIMVTEDGGITWTFVSPSTFGVPSAYHSLSCTNATTCWVAGEELNGHLAKNMFTDTKAAIWATSDSGKTWSHVRLPAHLGFVFEVTCSRVASCLATAWPPYVLGRNGIVQNVGAGEILSNSQG